MLHHIAYWIAFGPHGPRALPPPGEGRMIFGYTMLGVGVAFVLFFLIRSQARPPPGTMNQQYQEATNEYLRVTSSFPSCNILTHTNNLIHSCLNHNLSSSAIQLTSQSPLNRAKEQNPLPASHQKATRARAKYRVRQSETDVTRILLYFILLCSFLFVRCSEKIKPYVHLTHICPVRTSEILQLERNYYCDGQETEKNYGATSH